MCNTPFVCWLSLLDLLFWNQKYEEISSNLDFDFLGNLLSPSTSALFFANHQVISHPIHRQRSIHSIIRKMIQSVTPTDRSTTAPAIDRPRIDLWPLCRYQNDPPPLSSLVPRQVIIDFTSRQTAPV